MAHKPLIRFTFLPGLPSQNVPFLCSVLLLLVLPAAVPVLSFHLLYNINNIKQHKNTFKLYLKVVQLGAKCLIIIHKNQNVYPTWHQYIFC